MNWNWFAVPGLHVQDPSLRPPSCVGAGVASGEGEGPGAGDGLGFGATPTRRHTFPDAVRVHRRRTPFRTTTLPTFTDLPHLAPALGWAVAVDARPSAMRAAQASAIAILSTLASLSVSRKTVVMLSVHRHHPARGAYSLRPMSEARSLEVVFPGDTNHLGSLFGGTLMAWMDRAAYFAASRRARGAVVTRKVDELEFRVPIHVGDFVEMVARVESEGRTSMRVVVEVHREDPADGTRELCTTGHFVMVAVGEDGLPCPLPPPG